eukprot:scaffold77132_cov16-Tisochrysis_lutea.AAC.1
MKFTSFARCPLPRACSAWPSPLAASGGAERLEGSPVDVFERSNLTVSSKKKNSLAQVNLQLAGRHRHARMDAYTRTMRFRKEETTPAKKAARIEVEFPHASCSGVAEAMFRCPVQAKQPRPKSEEQQRLLLSTFPEVPHKRNFSLEPPNL